MIISLVSDLHVDFGNPVPPVPDDTDVLVIAGDICNGEPELWRETIAKVRYSYRGPVLLVMGNHEYYGRSFPESIADFRDAIRDDPNAILLEKQEWIFGGVRFLCATLWTDFCKWKLASECQIGMSDFQVIRTEDGKPITPKRVLQDHKEVMRWLGASFSAPFAGKTVVITHHAPSFRSQHPFFAGSKISGGFCSDLDDQILEWMPDLWIHGHVHDPMDYHVGDTRVLCNPIGYPDERNSIVFSTVEI